MLNHRLKIFTEVCKEGSETKAENSLFISQSGISRQIKKLEDDLGTKLIVFFCRNGKHKMELTSHGEILFRYCKKAIEDEEKMLEKLRKSKNQQPIISKVKGEYERLCKDDEYINGKDLNHFIGGNKRTRYERDRIYKELKSNSSIRKKIYRCGKRNFIYYHKEDVKNYMEKEIDT